MNDIKSTNLRLNMKKELHRKAWDYLQTMDKKQFKSYSHVIALSVVEYFDRYYKQQDDPYLETREREEQFTQQIVSAVEHAMEQILPAFLAGCLAGITNRGAEFTHGIPPDTAPSFEKPAATEDPASADTDIDWDFLGG